MNSSVRVEGKLYSREFNKDYQVRINKWWKLILWPSDNYVALCEELCMIAEEVLDE